MKFDRLLLMAIIFFLTGCSNSNTDLNNAITLSRDGLSNIEKSKENGIPDEEKEKLEKEGRAQINQAFGIYQKLISDHPENGVYINNYGWLQMRTGDLSGADITFKKAEAYRESIKPKDSLDANIKELQNLISRKKI